MELEWIPPQLDGGSKVTGYIVEFKEVNKDEEEKQAQRRLLLSDGEEEKEPESEESWEKVMILTWLQEDKEGSCQHFLLFTNSLFWNPYFSPPSLFTTDLFMTHRFCL